MVIILGGPVVGYLPSSVGRAGLTPARGTGSPHAAVQLRPCTATTLSPSARETTCHNQREVHEPQ